MAESARSHGNSHRGADGGPPTRVQFWIDIITKVLGGVAVAAVTYLGYRIQSSMSEISIRNQREQAETALRASMLGDLVGPIAGGTSASKSGVIDLRHERLLAELVTLNFHDHFEFKAVLAEIDEKMIGQEEYEEDRDKLASVAHRVIDRQLTMLNAYGAAFPPQSRGQLSRFYFIEQDASNETGGCLTGQETHSVDSFWANREMCAMSPDRRFCLRLFQAGSAKKLSDAYKTQQVALEMIVFKGEPEQTAKYCSDAQVDEDAARRSNHLAIDRLAITASTFDFPLTDNTVIDLNHRFAVQIVDMYRGSTKHPEYRPRLTVQVYWFPQGFVTERERPAYYSGQSKADQYQ